MKNRSGRGLRKFLIMVQFAFVLVLLGYVRAIAAILLGITSPLSGATVSGWVAISVTSSPRVSWINYYVDNNLLASATLDTYDWNSTKVSNGSHTLSVKAYNSKGSLLKSVSVAVNVSNPLTASTARATPTPDPTTTPTPAPTPSPAPTPTPTAAPTTSASCPAAPTLVNPQNPVDYGADATGAKDSTSAFASALNAGDILVPNGTYLINGAISVPGGRHIQCQSKSGVILKETNGCNYTEKMFDLTGPGSSVYNCTFYGPNANISGAGCAGSYNSFFVRLTDSRGDNDLILNNDFNGINGYVAAVTVLQHSGSVPANDVVICGNSFEHCGYNGWQVSGASNINIEYNTYNDCSGDVEYDASSGQVATGVVSHDTYTFTYGIGNNSAHGGTGFDGLTCGNAAGGNYSGMTCENNSIGGTHTSGVVESCGGGYACASAAYNNNTCTGGCKINQYD